jgi:hypothetical protein
MSKSLSIILLGAFCLLGSVSEKAQAETCLEVLKKCHADLKVACWAYQNHKAINQCLNALKSTLSYRDPCMAGLGPESISKSCTDRPL